MRWLPASLLGRTALMLALILILSQVASTALFRFYYNGVRAQQMANFIISNLDSIAVALETLPPEARSIYLWRMANTQGVRILSAARQPPAKAPESRFMRAVSEKVGQKYAAPLRIQPGKVILVWTRLPAAQGDVWVGLPLNRFDRGFPWPRVNWLFLVGILSILGAYLLVRRINAPLRQLERAAAEIGQGQQPPLLNEQGPSELKAVCRAFNQMAHNVRQLDQDRNLLLAGISHDLRTPLSRLRLAVEMLEQDRDPALAQEMIQDIEDINVIIDQFLSYVRNEADESAHAESLNALVRDVTERYARRPDPAWIELRLGALPDFAFRPLAMQRLLSNLLDNALRHGWPPVEVRTESRDGCILLHVLDRGPGIPEAAQQRLLQPFARLDEARSAGGSGLGLAIVERIAQHHHGHFHLENRPGGGLHAWVALPLTTTPKS